MTSLLLQSTLYANFKQIILSDFEGLKPPTYCGVDLTTGDDKFCCIGLNKAETEIKPQLPQFPVSGTVSKPRPCIDHTSICPQWLQADPESCDDPWHPSYRFMRAACQETCGRCGNDVSLKKCQHKCGNM